MAEERYLDMLNIIEGGLHPLAFRSASGQTIFQDDILRPLQDQWHTPEGKARLRGRTPAMLERDRILYSNQFRRQDDKSHTLFVDEKRVSRSFTSHSVRAAHLARSIAARLRLNSDFAEAVALGAKTGAVSFIHVGKEVVDEWLKKKISDADQAAEDSGSMENQPAMLSVSDKGEVQVNLPGWVEDLRSPSVRALVEKHIPWARSATNPNPSYGSGQDGYWELTLNPFTLDDRGNTAFMAQTMYGIWRHSIITPQSDKFIHALKLGSRDRLISDNHLTHEAIVVRYCDDIAWVIENLSESSKAASLARRQLTIFQELSQRNAADLPREVIVALSTGDSGRLYTYFVDDLVATTEKNMGVTDSSQLREMEPIVSMSQTAMSVLDVMKVFLMNRIFESDRIKNRNETLKVLLRHALEVLYRSRLSLESEIERIAQRDGWYAGEGMSRVGGEAMKLAKSLLDNPIHRAQASVSVLAAMSDREIYDFVGLE